MAFVFIISNPIYVNFAKHFTENSKKAKTPILLPNAVHKYVTSFPVDDVESDLSTKHNLQSKITGGQRNGIRLNLI